jgi:hypothetical protein
MASVVGAAAEDDDALGSAAEEDSDAAGSVSEPQAVMVRARPETAATRTLRVRVVLFTMVLL